MPNIRPIHFLLWLLLPATLAVSGNAASRTWTGALNTNWAAARNWAGNVVPARGDALIFPATGLQRETWNSLTTPFASLTFSDSYAVAGSPVRTALLSFQGSVSNSVFDTLFFDAPLVLTNGGNIQVTTGRLTLLREVSLPANGATLSVFRWPHASLPPLSAFRDSALSFNGRITGGGAIRKVDDGDVFFRTNNTYTGGTIIEAGAIHLDYGDDRLFSELPFATPFGPSDQIVEVRNEASLVLSQPMKLDYTVTLNGSGERNLGAIRLNGKRLGAKHLIRAFVLGSAAKIGGDLPSGGRLGVGLISSSTVPPPPLRFHADAILSLVGGQARLKVPLRLSWGTFMALDTNLETAPLSELSWPRVEQSVNAGNPDESGARYPAIADLTVPESLATNLPTAVSVIADDVPITASYAGEVMFGPRQHGLGSPLTLRAGAVLLVPSKSLSNTVAGFHSGTVHVENARFDVSSYIFGPLGIPDTLTLSSTANPTPELTFRELDRTFHRSWIEGDTLIVDGVHLKLFGTQPNRLGRLIVNRGSLALGQLGGSGAAAWTTIGQDGRLAPRVNLSAGAGQFPEGAVLEIKQSGSFTMLASQPPSNHVARLRMSGGRLTPMKLSCDSLEFEDGTWVFFNASAGKTNLSVLGDWTWQGTVRGGLALGGLEFQAPVMVRLVDFQGNRPIPGRFDGLPDGGTVTNNAVVYRINYSGGDGNDLVLDPVAPSEPTKLTLTQPIGGAPAISWPESASCLLEFQPAYDPPGVWTPVPAGPAVDGKFTWVITPTDERPSGFYRLNCP